MHTFKTSAVLLLATCLAQVIAVPYGGGGSQDNTGSGNSVQAFGEGNGNGRENGNYGGQNGQGPSGSQGGNNTGGDGQDKNIGGNANNQDGGGNGNENGNASEATILISTVTVTMSATPLTVMTVTVTAPCSAPPIAGDANGAVSTSVIAAPQVMDPNAPQKFVTPGVDVPQGLTSIPVAIASALEQGGGFAIGAAGGPPAAASSSATTTSAAGPPATTAPPAPPSAPSLLSQVSEQEYTFLTSGSIVPGRSSIPITASGS